MFYLVIATLLFTAVSLLSAAASRRMSPALTTLILNIFSILAPLTFLLAAKFKGQEISTKAAVIYAALAGISVGLYGLFINKSFVENKVGVVLPVIFGGTILLSAILSYFIFKESLKPLEIAGLGLILVGIGFIIYARSYA